MFFMMYAYIRNKPQLVMGKKLDGSFNLNLLKINLPWLLFTWIIFQIQIRFNREEFSHNIIGTNLWISRKPGGKDSLDKFDTLVDLTCEFPRDQFNLNYICCPNLDGHELSELPVIQDLPKDKNILIHCANGHGRSSLYVAIVLVNWNVVATYEEALQLILKSRALAKPNSSQKKWLYSFDKKD